MNEEKIEAVKRYLEGIVGCPTIAKEIGVHKRSLRRTDLKVNIDFITCKNGKKVLNETTFFFLL